MFKQDKILADSKVNLRKEICTHTGVVLLHTLKHKRKCLVALFCLSIAKMLQKRLRKKHGLRTK